MVRTRRCSVGTTDSARSTAAAPPGLSGAASTASTKNVPIHQTSWARLRRHRAPGQEYPRSDGELAAGVVGDREAERARGRVVLEFVPAALQSGRRHEEAEHGGLVGRPL